MVIGSFGDVVFEVSRDKVKTFDEFKRSGSARWASHEIINKKQVMEFLGPGIETITFSIYLSSGLGVNPEEELKKIRKMRDEGTPKPLIIADNMVGENNWVLKSLDESSSKFDSKGNALVVVVNLTLDEYTKALKS